MSTDTIACRSCGVPVHIAPEESGPQTIATCGRCAHTPLAVITTTKGTDMPTTDTKMTIQDLLDLYGGRLADNFRAGYTTGYERTLAEELIGKLNEAGRREALRYLIHSKLSDLVAVNSLLDECNEDSYRTEDKMADLLFAEIEKQGRPGFALYELVMDEICDRRHRFLAPAPAATETEWQATVDRMVTG